MARPENPSYIAAKEAYASAMQLEEQARAKGETALKHIEDVQETIRNGLPVTDSPLLDFLIVRHGFAAESELPSYVDLEQKMKGHVGELVLRVERHPELRTHSPLPSPLGLEDYTVSETIGLGVLTGESLVLDPSMPEQIRVREFGMQYGGTSDFPTSGSAMYYSRSQTTEFVDEPLSASLMGLGEKLEVGTTFPRGETIFLHPRKLEVAVGNEEVYRWFRDNKRADVQEKLMPHLNRPLPLA